ncbi:KAP family P-loop NTPase fold protein [Haloferax volcanii]|uniref:KAP family P-loop NTPase fold protein n=1 Tax=Haloferax volcanii TaxID=2246 RepID=UPI00385230A5
MGTEDQNLYLSDKPIDSEEQDQFRHTEYVDSLEKILQKTSPPWHIGLFGEWGSGKTSIIRLLRNRVNQKPEFNDTIFVEYDAWKHAEESIRTDLLLGIDQALGRELDTKPDGSYGILGEEKITEELYDITEEQVVDDLSYRDYIQKLVQESKLLTAIVGITGAVLIVGVLTNILSLLGAVSLGQNLLGTVNSILQIAILPLFLSLFVFMAKQVESATSSLRRSPPRNEWTGAYEQLFSEILAEVEVKSKKETVVISIDNLDRCESETVYDVLVSLKTYLEHDKCIYIIPCDDAALTSHIRSIDAGEYFEDTENEHEFLRKFFQTHIRVPPFLPEDIENYAFNLNEQLSSPFEDEAIDVVTNAYLDNPRRIKHAINRLATLRVIAQEVEEEGSLNRGRITDNQPFLAKVSILQEDHREFFQKLSNDPYLLEDVNGYFNSKLTEESKIQRVENSIKTNNSEYQAPLERFLRATRRVTATNPEPFLTLSEPSYSTNVSGMDAFLRNLRSSNEEEIRDELEKLDEENVSFDDYHEAISETLEKYSSSKRQQPLYSTIDTLAAVFDVFSPESQELLAETIGDYLNSDIGEGLLTDFDPVQMLQVVLIMPDYHRRDLLDEYANIVDSNGEVQSNVLQAFIENAEEIPPTAIHELNKVLYRFDEKEIPKALDQIADSEPAKQHLVNQRLIHRAFELVQLEDNKNEYQNTRYYLQFDNVASKRTRTEYVNKLLDLRDTYSKNQAPQMNEELSKELRMISSEISTTGAGKLLNGLEEMETEHRNQEQIYLVETAFHFFDSFSGESIEQFGEWMHQVFRNYNVNNVGEVIGFYKGYGVDQFQTQKEVEGVLGRIPANINDKELIVNTIIPLVPEEYNQLVYDKVSELIRTNNNSQTQIGLEAFQVHASRLEEHWGELINQCGTQAQRENNRNRKKEYLEPGMNLFSQFEGPNQEQYLNSLSDLLNGGNNEYQIYQEIWIEIEEDAGDDRRESVARDVHSTLISQIESGQNPIHLDPLFTVLETNLQSLGTDEGQQLVDRQSKRLNEGNLNHKQKATVLEQLTQLSTYFDKEGQVLDRVQTLLDQNDRNNVRQQAEKLLKRMVDIEDVSDRARQIQEEYFPESE